MSNASLVQASGDLPTDWDVIVIGGGPAGGVAALLAVRSDLRTLLIEAKATPRPKVCGGCLNARSQQVLSEVGLLASLIESGATRVQGLRLVCGGQSLDSSIESMISVSRRTMDDCILQHAKREGVTILDRTTASLVEEKNDERRTVRLTRPDRSTAMMTARVVIGASGLTSNAMSDLQGFHSTVATDARIGVGALFASDWGRDEERNILTMVVGRDGYVGLARVENQLLNVAAAIDSDALRKAGSIPKLIRSILDECCTEVPSEIDFADWTGTPPLTRITNRISGHRLLLLGDATGYVEPFTGEGMAWALQAAAISSPLVREGCTAWSASLEERWETMHRTQIKKRQVACRGLCGLLRYRRLSEWALYLAKRSPRLTRRIVNRITGGSPKGLPTVYSPMASLREPTLR